MFHVQWMNSFVNIYNKLIAGSIQSFSKCWLNTKNLKTSNILIICFVCSFVMSVFWLNLLFFKRFTHDIVRKRSFLGAANDTIWKKFFKNVYVWCFYDVKIAKMNHYHQSMPWLLLVQWFQMWEFLCSHIAIKLHEQKFVVPGCSYLLVNPHFWLKFPKNLQFLCRKIWTRKKNNFFLFIA